MTHDFAILVLANDALVFSLIGAIAVIVIGVIVAAIIYEKKRQAAMEALALEMGVQYTKKVGDPAGQSFSQMSLFNRGRSRRIQNMLHGQVDNLAMSLFDYRYTVGTGKNSSTYSQTVLVIDQPGAQLPEFELRPEHFFDRIGDMLGWNDIDFDAHPDFSARFKLKGPDEQAIRRVFTDEVIQLFEQTQGKWTVEASGSILMIYRRGRRLKPALMPEWVEQGMTLQALLIAQTQASQTPQDA